MTHLRKIFVAAFIGVFAVAAAGAADLPPLDAVA